MKKIHLLFITLWCATVFVACKKDSSGGGSNTPIYKVIKTEDITTKMLAHRMEIDTTSELVTQLPNVKLRLVAIEYVTQDPRGNKVMASGLITYPADRKDFDKMNVVLGEHYTIGANFESPTGSMSVFEALTASLGYVVVSPDYIGFGSTIAKDHPYHHVESTGQVSAAMLFAVKEYVASLKATLSNQLIIMGYSQGGHATISCLKYIQERFPSAFVIRKVYAGAGAYDLRGTYDEILLHDKETSSPATVPMVFLGLNYGDNLGLDFTKAFKAALLSNYQDWFLTKKYTEEEIETMMGTTKVEDFLAPEVFQPQHPNTAKLLASLEKNSLIKGWTPNAKTDVHLVHGNKDTTVPFYNSQRLYDEWKKQGCNNVTLVPLEGMDHEEGTPLFYIYAFTDLLKSQPSAEN